jgi:hypothetical protein
VIYRLPLNGKSGGLWRLHSLPKWRSSLVKRWLCTKPSQHHRHAHWCGKDPPFLSHTVSLENGTDRPWHRGGNGIAKQEATISFGVKSDTVISDNNQQSDQQTKRSLSNVTKTFFMFTSFTTVPRACVILFGWYTDKGLNSLREWQVCKPRPR